MVTKSVRGEARALRRRSAAWPQGYTPHPEHLQEQQQGENRVKSLLFHMSGEWALLTTCSKRRSPPGADVPGGWICRHRASRTPLTSRRRTGTSAQLWRSEGGRWRGNTTSRRSWRSISHARSLKIRDVGDFDTPAQHFSEFFDLSHEAERAGSPLDRIGAAPFPISILQFGRPDQAQRRGSGKRPST
jgi:hypothetical protein